MTDNNVTNINDALDNASAPGARPILTLHGTGGIQVAVWKNKSESGIDNYSVRMERSFKDGEGSFKSTPYLRDGDLLRAQKLLTEADDWIEQDKQKHRTSGAGRA